MRSGAHRGRLIIAALALAAAGVAAGGTAAQTWNCGADSLRLATPPEITVSLVLTDTVRAGGRVGALVRWDDLDDSVSACAVLKDTTGFGAPLTLSGEYADDVDRVLAFEVLADGEVGSRTQNRLPVRWSNAFVSRTGTIVGEINLSNSGGVWRWDPASDTWEQRNGGLPNYLPYTNVVAMDVSTAGGARNRLVALSGGETNTSLYRGLYLAENDGPYQRIAADIFTDTRGITAVAYAPGSTDRFAVGTRSDGLFVTTDGGATFRQLRSELEPAAIQPSEFRITALHWTASRLYVAVRAFGLFASEDGGQNFTRFGQLRLPQNLDVTGSPLAYPEVLRIHEARQDMNHVVLGLRDHGLYHTLDAGASWQNLTGGLTVPDPEQPGAWRHSAASFLFAAGGPGTGDDLYVLGTSQRGLFRSWDGGASWSRIAGDLLEDSGWVTVPIAGLVAVPGRPGHLLAAASTLGLLYSPNAGVDWSLLPGQPAISQAVDLVTGADGALYYATYGGGIYRAGESFSISSTILPGSTADEYDDLDLGLDLAVGQGVLETQATFKVVAQDFQGWIVWRSLRENPDDMQMIGRYDKTNPETCIVGYCGEDFALLPNCFGERRAACFDFRTPGEISFYDDDIYNAFDYYYSVTTFDYGNTADVAPTALRKPMIFSPRFAGDPHSPFDGEGNRQAFQVNFPVQPAPDGPEIYAFPNPLRGGTGFPGGEGDQVVFANLPQNSRVLVFTMAGDIVAEVGPESQVESNIYWRARNSDNQLLASGIYIWKVEMPERGDFWGRLVIIR
ncbi:MAG: hypothetical protein R6X25_09820 [Candidatus Krumholzibacteriia bacterium]